MLVLRIRKTNRHTWCDTDCVDVYYFYLKWVPLVLPMACLSFGATLFCMLWYLYGFVFCLCSCSYVSSFDFTVGCEYFHSIPKKTAGTKVVVFGESGIVFHTPCACHHQLGS